MSAREGYSRWHVCAPGPGFTQRALAIKVWQRDKCYGFVSADGPEDPARLRSLGLEFYWDAARANWMWRRAPSGQAHGSDDELFAAGWAIVAAWKAGAA